MPKSSTPYHPKGKKGTPRPKSRSTRSPPMAVRTVAPSTRLRDSDVMRATEHYSIFSIPAQLENVVVTNIWLNPQQLGGRIATISTLWDRFKINNIKLHYNPAVPTTTGGRLYMWHDADISDTTPTGADILAQSSAHLINTNFSVWERGCLNVPLRPEVKYYCRDTSAEQRTEYQGQLYVAYLGPSLGQQTMYGTLSVEYDITFYDPNLNSASEPVIVTAPAVLAPLPVGTVSHRLNDVVLKVSDIVTTSVGGNSMIKLAAKEAARYMVKSMRGYTSGVSTPIIDDLVMGVLDPTTNVTTPAPLAIEPGNADTTVDYSRMTGTSGPLLAGGTILNSAIWNLINDKPYDVFLDVKQSCPTALVTPYAGPDFSASVRRLMGSLGSAIPLSKFM